MSDPREQDGTLPRTNFRLETGLDVLDDWARTASRPEKNAVYAALFSMLDGTLLRSYRIVDDFQHLSELSVILNEDLALKIRINCCDSFGVVRIGPPVSPVTGS